MKSPRRAIRDLLRDYPVTGDTLVLLADASGSLAALADVVEMDIASPRIAQRMREIAANIDTVATSLQIAERDAARADADLSRRRDR